jgi:hypothetical protein
MSEDRKQMSESRRQMTENRWLIPYEAEEGLLNGEVGMRKSESGM